MVDKINLKEEAKAAVKKIAATPDLVSSSSSVHALRSELGQKSDPHDSEMLGGIKSDLVREALSNMISG